MAIRGPEQTRFVLEPFKDPVDYASERSKNMKDRQRHRSGSVAEMLEKRQKAGEEEEKGKEE